MHSLTKRLISLTAALAEVCIECAERANASYEIMIQYWKDYQIDSLDQFLTTSDPDLLVSQMDGYISPPAGFTLWILQYRSSSAKRSRRILQATRR